MMRNCPICDNNHENSLPLARISPPSWSLVRCCACGFVYLRNPPDYDTLGSDFAWEITYDKEKDRRHSRQSLLGRQIRRVLLSIKTSWRHLFRSNTLQSTARKLFTRAGHCVELGSDTGYNVDRLPEHIIPIGIEISPVLANRSISRFEARRGRVINAPALHGLSTLDSASCVGAVAISYLEHESNPKQTLSELHRVLKSSSPVIIKVPNYQCWLRHIRGKHWSGFRFPDHVNYFTPKSLIRLLCNCGFDIYRFRLSDRMPTSDNMWCIARRK